MRSNLRPYLVDSLGALIRAFSQVIYPREHQTVVNEAHLVLLGDEEASEILQSSRLFNSVSHRIGLHEVVVGGGGALAHEGLRVGEGSQLEGGRSP